MRRKGKITFVGPLAGSSVDPTPEGSRTKGSCFLLVQGAGDAVRLEYPSLKAARAARKDLLALPLSHAVADPYLLAAIQTALAEAAEKKPQGEPIEYESAHE